MRGALFDTLGHDFTKSSASVGSQLIYAATHQFGDSSRGIPARSFLGVSIQDEREIVTAAEDYLGAAIA